MNLKDGQIFHIITYGQKNMPALAAQVLREDRWKAALYIRSMQAAKKQRAAK
jgi:mono/diheme cytochrome c family protein